METAQAIKSWIFPGAFIAFWVMCVLGNVGIVIQRLRGGWASPAPFIGLMCGISGLVLAPVSLSRETVIWIVGVILFVEAVGFLCPVVEWSDSAPKSKRG